MNVGVNVTHPDIAGDFPFIGTAVALAIALTAPWRRPDWSVVPGAVKGSIFLLCLVASASLMPVESLAGAVMGERARARFRVVVLRQHPAHGARAEPGRLRLGRARLCRRLRRLDALVRLLGRRRDLQHVSRGALDGTLAARGLAGRGRLRRGLRGAASRRSAGSRAASPSGSARSDVPTRSATAAAPRPAARRRRSRARRRARASSRASPAWA